VNARVGVAVVAVTGLAALHPPPSAAEPVVPRPPSPPYSGHGAGSVPATVLSRYAPPPLPGDLTRGIQNMFDVRSPELGRVSSDGKRLFFSWNVTGTEQVWRLDGPRSFPVQLTGGEDRTWLSAVAPDGTFLVISRDRGGEEYPGLYLQSPEGGPLRLLHHSPRVQTFLELVSDDSRYIYFRANDIQPDSYAIYRHDRKSGKKETLFSQPGLWDIADHRPDGRLLLQKETGASRSEFYEWSPATGKLEPLFGQGEQEEYKARYGAATGEVLVLTPRLGEFRRLYRWRAGQLTAVTPQISHDVLDFSIDRSRRRILYMINEGGFFRLRGLDGRSYRPLELPTLPASDHVFMGPSSADGRYVVLGVNTGKAPMLSYVLDWKTGRIAPWQMPSAPEVDLSRFSRPTLEHYPARDGTPIPMFVRRPVHCAQNPGRAPPLPRSDSARGSAVNCPVVVMFHGGPEGQALPGFSAHVQLFVENGFVLVEPNVRGSSGYGKTWVHADDGARRLDVITDIEDCARYIRKAWAKDGRAPRLGVVGWSYGGYAALMGMSMFAGAYDVGVSSIGPSNLVTLLTNTATHRRALRITEYGDPQKDRETLLRLSPISYLDRVKGPLLIIHGANDQRVPVGEAIQVHEALQARGVESRLILFSDEGHGVEKRENQVLEWGHLLQFLRKHLLPTS
jgi:dipeptidyl aminopeptidase/acylaminoacyl peptidase